MPFNSFVPKTLLIPHTASVFSSCKYGEGNDNAWSIRHQRAFPVNILDVHFFVPRDHMSPQDGDIDHCTLRAFP